MNRRTGFSLVEIVVVVMILGIIAAIAVPRVWKAVDRADETTVEYSVKVIRDAIDLYATMNQGRLPGESGSADDFKADLRPYVRQFPTNPIMKSSDVRVETSGQPLSGVVGGNEGWLYDNQTGEFIANTPGAGAPSAQTVAEPPATASASGGI
jgi:general secretion pathway protein G